MLFSIDLAVESQQYNGLCVLKGLGGLWCWFWRFRNELKWDLKNSGNVTRCGTLCRLDCPQNILSLSIFDPFFFKKLRWPCWLIEYLRRDNLFSPFNPLDS